MERNQPGPTTREFHLEVTFLYDKVTHKHQEKQITHTYDLIEAKISIKARK